jgi:hypothetical protein
MWCVAIKLNRVPWLLASCVPASTETLFMNSQVLQAVNHNQRSRQQPSTLGWRKMPTQAVMLCLVWCARICVLSKC